jgi:hypothetical protein
MLLWRMGHACVIGVKGGYASPDQDETKAALPFGKNIRIKKDKRVCACPHRLYYGRFPFCQSPNLTPPSFGQTFWA